MKNYSFNEKNEINTSDNISHKIQEIKSAKETIQIELIGQTYLQELNKLQKLAIDKSVICKQNIKWLKSSLESKPSHIYSQQLSELKQLKQDLGQLESDLLQQQELMQNRDKLYQSRILAQTPSFEELLNYEITKHPELKEGCDHLKHVLALHMRMEKGGLSNNDIEQLKKFLNIVCPSSKDLTALIEHEISVLEKTFTRKRTLLEELTPLLSGQPKPFHQWSNDEKIELFVRAQQILNHPYEPPIDVIAFFNTLQNDAQDGKVINLCKILQKECEVNKPKSKKEFWDFLPILEKKAHDLANTSEQKEQLYIYKMEGLKHILSKVNEQDSEEALIIGGGPSGLMHALSMSFAGHPYRVIEKRASDKQNRANVITLGKNDPKDLSILLFFGVLSYLDKEQKPSFGHIKPHLLEVKIGDVETALKETMQGLNLLKHVDFCKQVISIDKQNQQAQVIVADVDNPNRQETLNSSLLIVTDGSSSPTRKMLGISKTVLAKTTQIAYSIFQKTPPQSSWEAIKYRIHNALKGIVLGISVIINRLFFHHSLETAFGHAIEGGPSAIFRIPEQDYLIRCLREKEQGFINSYRQQIADLDRKIKKREAQQNLSVKQQDKIKNDIQKRDQLSQDLEAHLTQQGQKIHRLLDVLTSFYSKKHRIRPMQVNKNYLVDIVVGKAERSHVYIGQTPVILRGDSSHTTDPYSGYGCKTAIEETLADQFLFSYDQLGALNPLEQACQNWGHQHYQYSMINQGLRERSLYRDRTELLQRYTDLAIRNALCSEAEALEFQKIAAKMKIKDSSSFKEELFLKQFHQKLRLKLKEIIENPSWNWKELDRNWQHHLTSYEKKYLQGIVKKLIENSSQSVYSSEVIEPILAKLAYEDSPLAPIIALLIQHHLEQFE